MSNPHADGGTLLFEIAGRIENPLIRRGIEDFAHAYEREQIGITDLMAARDGMNLLYYMTLREVLPEGSSDEIQEDRKAVRDQVIATAQAWEDTLLRIAQIRPLVPYIRRFGYIGFAIVVFQLITIILLAVVVRLVWQ